MDPETSQIIEGSEIMYHLLDRAEQEADEYGDDTYKVYLNLNSYRDLVKSLMCNVRISAGSPNGPSGNVYGDTLFLQYSRGQVAVYCLPKLKANEYIWNGNLGNLFNGLDRACRIAKLGKR